MTMSGGGGRSSAAARRPPVSLRLGSAVLAALVLANLPITRAGAQATEPELVATAAGITQFSQFAAGLATAGRLAEVLPSVRLTPGGDAGLRLRDLFARAVADRLITADPPLRAFADLERLSTSAGGIELEPGGRRAVITAKTSRAGSVHTVALAVRVTRTVEAPLHLSNQSPLVELSSPSGVRAMLAFAADLTFSFDAATSFFYLVKDSSSPRLSVDVVATIPDATQVDASLGILGAVVATANLSLEAHFTGTLDDPNHDGKLAFVEPGSAGPVRGELATAGGIADLAQITFDVGRRNALNGALMLATRPSSIPGMSLPSISAGLTVTDNDLADGTAPVVTTTGFDGVLDKFQNLKPRDLAEGLAQLAVLIRALQVSQAGGVGDVDLPFLKGRLSDVVVANETLVAFLAQNVFPVDESVPVELQGEPKFSSIQDFFDALTHLTFDSTIVRHLAIRVEDVGYEDATSKLNFTLTIEKGDLPHAVAGDSGLGAVTLGDTFQATAGIVGANAKVSTAQIAPDYRLSLTFVLDLQPARTGAACTPACPYEQTGADGVTKTIITSQPITPERFLIRTGVPLLSATAPLATNVDVSPRVGFLSTDLTGNLTVSPNDPTKPMLEIGLRPTGDAQHDVPLLTAFRTVRENPRSLFDVTVRAKADADLKLAVSQIGDFFGGGTASVALTWPDITDQSGLKITPDVNFTSLHDFDFGGPTNSRALLGLIVDHLGALADGIRLLPGGDAQVRQLLDFPIPLVGVTPASLLDLSGLENPVKDLRANPPDTLQDLLAALNGSAEPPATAAAGAAKPLQVKASIDKSTTPKRLILSLAVNQPIARDLPFEFSTDGGRLVGVSAKGSPKLRANLVGTFKVAVPLEPKKGIPVPQDLLIYPDSRFRLDVGAQLRDGELKAHVGPLTLLLGNPGGTPSDPATVDLALGLELSDRNANHVPGTTVSLSEWARGLRGDLTGLPAQKCGSADDLQLILCAVLPTYRIGNAGSPVRIPKDSARSNTFVFRVPTNDPFSSAPLPNGLPRFATPDAVLADELSSAIVDLTQLDAGTGRFIDQIILALDFASFGGKLPLLGKDLQRASTDVAALRQQLVTNNNLAVDDNLTIGELRTRIDKVLADPLRKANVLNALTTTIKCRDTACADGDKALDMEEVLFTLDLGRGDPDNLDRCADCVRQIDLSTSLGIPGLLLSVSAPDVAVGVAWNLRVSFGLSRTTGFFLATDPVPTLKVAVSVTLPTEMEGDLSFVHVDMTPMPGYGAEKAFSGLFTMQFPGASGATDNGRAAAPAVAARQSLAAVGAATGGRPFSVSLQGSASVHRHFVASAGSAAFPGLSGDFSLDWGWNSQSPDDSTALVMKFTDVKIGADAFMSEVLGSVLREVKRIAAPLRPVIDTLYAPLPVVSKLSRIAGGGDISLATLVEKFNSLEGGPDFTLVTRLLLILKLADDLTNPARTGQAPRVGSFFVDKDKALLGTPTPDQAGDLVVPVDVEADLQAKLDSGGERHFIAEARDAGLTFPFLESGATTSVFQMLMGKDVTLARLDAGVLRAAFTYSQPFGPVWPVPPVFVTVSGSASISLRLAAGLDTYGLRRAFERGKKSGSFVRSGILDGLFIDDLDVSGKDVPEISLSGELAAGAMVSVAIVSAGVEGGIRLTVNLNLADPDHDGKVRFAEFRAGLANPYCLFDITGQISAFLRAYLKIRIGPFKKRKNFQLADVVLLNLAKSCPFRNSLPPEPRIAGIDGTTLVIFTGRLGDEAHRQGGWGNNNDEHNGIPTLVPKNGEERVAVRSLVAKGEFVGFSVEMLGRREEFRNPGLERVLVDARGYPGRQTVLFLGGGDPSDAGRRTLPFEKSATVLGGNGNDFIDAGDGPAWVDGGPGDDEILTGPRDDVIAGGSGNDRISAGAGDDKIAGDAALLYDGGVTVRFPEVPAESSTDGDDEIDAGLGRDVVYGGGGADQLDGGNDSTLALTHPGDPAFVDSPNLLVGGRGADTIHGGPADDLIYGDEQSDLGADDDGAAGGGDDVIDTGLGNDTVRGGGGNDTVISRSTGATRSVVYGNGGDDSIEGGDGPDLLFGGAGDDIVTGGRGADEILGGRGDDRLVGGPGADLIDGGPGADGITGDDGVVDLTAPGTPVLPGAPSPGDGGDVIHGGPGGDTLDGGGGDDTIDGDTGTPRCASPAPGSPEWTAPEEAAAAGAGPDRIDGGPGADRVDGDGGDDTILGAAGDDLLCGEDGKDVIRGGTGSDRIWGGSGNDALYGDYEADRVYGGGDDDELYGGVGGDHLEGNGGSDTVLGEADDDELVGGSSTSAPDTGDVLVGGRGDDVLIGDNGTVGPELAIVVLDLESADGSLGGADTVDGGAGDDSGFGGIGDDALFGDVGDDHLEGNPGADNLHGGAGRDDLVGGTSPLARGGGARAGVPDTGDELFGGDGADVLVGDNGSIERVGPDPNDSGRDRRVVLLDLTTVGGADTLRGEGGSDHAFGGLGADTLLGGAEDDHLEGNGGPDRLVGEAGEDDLIGGTSPMGMASGSTEDVGDDGDQIDGGDAADYVLGDNGSIVRQVDPAGRWRRSLADGSVLRAVSLLQSQVVGGADTIAGGTGNDRIWGELAADVLDGGDGDDYLEGDAGDDVISGGTGSDDLIGGSSPVGFDDGPVGDGIAADSSDGNDRMYGLAGDQTTDTADDDVLVGDNGRIDRCPAAQNRPAGRDACRWTSKSYGQDATGRPFGSVITRFVTLLGESRDRTNHDGNDVMQGNSGNDVLYGENGNDILEGNDGQDGAYGGYGDDLIRGGTGNDALLGDRGVITVVPLAGTPAPREIRSAGPPPLVETIYVRNTIWYKVLLLDPGFGGSDEIFGNAGDDSIHGGAGHDHLQGDDGFHAVGGPAPATGDDRIFGDDGQDSIEGGPGRDHLFGGAGEDDLDVIRGPVPVVKVPAATAHWNPVLPSGYDYDPGAEGEDIVFGGHDRDVLQADAAGDRLVDANGNFNLFLVCPARYGGSQITRSVSPGLRDFLRDLAEADGAIGTRGALSDTASTGAGELSVVEPGDSGNAGSAYAGSPGHLTCP